MGATVFTAAGLASFAAVANEYLLSRSVGSLNLQNIGMYTVGLCLMVCVVLPRQTKTASDAAGWLHFPNRDEQLLIALHSILGILTSHFLKKLGVIWREVSSGAILLADVFLDLREAESG